jgi:predicted phosphodiesterase
MSRHMVIPDTQVKPGESIDHLTWAGKYAVEMQPDVIVHLGDHWDMSSLSSYDKGKACFEGRRYVKDIEAGNAALDAFMAPIRDFQAQQRASKKKMYNPRLIFIRGNHEERIERAINDDAMLEDLMSFDDDSNVHDWGWEVYPFLEVVVVDGVAYSHYFTSGVMGRPVSSARLMLTKKHMSCVMGHVQQRDIAFATRADGKRMTGIFGGVFSPHAESYLNAQTNEHWRGLWMLHEVDDGQFDEMPVSLNYLESKYE